MNIASTIKNYLYDKEYFINIYGNKIYLYNYQEIIHLSDSLIKVSFENFNIELDGKNFKVVKMLQREIMFEGLLLKLEIINHD